jgi:hypothetical protein
VPPVVASVFPEICEAQRRRLQRKSSPRRHHPLSRGKAEKEKGRKRDLPLSPPVRAATLSSLLLIPSIVCAAFNLDQKRAKLRTSWPKPGSSPSLPPPTHSNDPNARGTSQGRRTEGYGPLLGSDRASHLEGRLGAGKGPFPSPPLYTPRTTLMFAWTGQGVRCQPYGHHATCAVSPFPVISASFAHLRPCTGQGKYPLPPGTSPIIGVEFSGTIEDANGSDFKNGEAVCVFFFLLRRFFALFALPLLSYPLF